MKNITFVTYSSNDEIIVTTPENEQRTKETYFDDPDDRDIQDYDRKEHFEAAITIAPTLRVKWG